MVYNGQPYQKWMIWGYHHFRKPPYGLHKPPNLGGLVYALWQRRQWQYQAQQAQMAVRDRRFMELCTFLLATRVASDFVKGVG